MDNKKFDQVIKQNVGFISGLASGVVYILLGQPFDTVKIRLQVTQNQNQTIGQTVKQLIQEDGLRGFYKGTTAPLIGIGAITSIQFGVFEKMKKNFQQNSEKLNFQQLVTSGSISCLAASIFTIPVEHIRIKMQIQMQSSKLFPNSLSCFGQIYSQYGIQGLYRGMGVGVIRESLMGLKYGGYSYLMQQGNMKNTNQKQNSIISGAVSGFLTWLIIYPIDSIKSKMQGDNLKSPKYQSYSQIIRTTSFKQLYHGLIPCLQRSIVVNMGGFLAYEQVKQLICSNFKDYQY